MNPKENEYLLFSSTSAIIDFGSGMVKAGMSGDEKPTCVFPSLIGYPKFNQILPLSLETQVVGPSREVRGLYRLEKPIRRGVLHSETDAKLLLQKVYNGLKLNNNKDVPVFIAEPPFTSKRQKKILTEQLLEQQDCPSVFFGTQGVLAVYGMGENNGMVLESGEGLSQVVPVFGGYKLDYAVEKVEFGGEDVTNYLRLLLRRSGVHLKGSSEECIVQEIKEQVCQLNQKTYDNTLQGVDKVALQGEPDPSQQDLLRYELPDGQTIEVGAERYMAPEILFNPALAGVEYSGLHNFLHASMNKIDMDLKRTLYEKVCLSGGNTQLAGFTERFARELNNLLGNNTKVEIRAPNGDRSLVVFKGATAITSINTFSKMWITKKEVQEKGDRVFLLKHF